MNKYITTAIYYANSKLHIGSAYEICYADSINRYFKQCHDTTVFQTGMDEHGQKIMNSALNTNMTPQQLVDGLADNTKDLFAKLNIDYDRFIRTSDPHHKELVQLIFTKLLNQGDIYLDYYEGKYCVACESFFLETQLVDGKCPDCGREVEIVKEESYFFNLKKYESRLIEHIKTHDNFILPVTRRNEVLSFLEQGLENLSVSRTSFDWGISVNENPKHVVYVWLDALSNYITNAGYVKNNEQFDLEWNNSEIVHVIGKDILRFHAIYWPIFLMALDLKLPDTILVHGFIMMKDEKISKSLGNVIYAEDYIEEFGLDPLRFYLLQELANGNDGNFTKEMFIDRYNFELVNDLSNLLNRTIAMANKYFDTAVVKTDQFTEFDENLMLNISSCLDSYHAAMQKYDTQKAIKAVLKLVSQTNKYIDETTPWAIKDNNDLLMTIIFNLLESLRCIAILFKPFMPDTSLEMLRQLNQEDDFSFNNIHINLNNKYENLESKIMYQRLDKDAIMAKEVEVVEEKFITIDQFDEVELVVAKVLDCKNHPNADKLLVFQLDDGKRTRQIVSGIAKYYKPSDLIGKNVVIVANLKPITLRGELSEGMILSAEFDSKLQVLTSESNPGSQIK